mgnify:FL=1
MICKNCSSDICDTAKFCPKCGVKIEAIKPQETKKCPACGAANPITAKFCRADGFNFQQALETQSKNLDIETTAQQEITAPQAKDEVREAALRKPLKAWIKASVLGSICIIAGVGGGSYLYFSGLIGKKADVNTDVPQNLPTATEQTISYEDAKVGTAVENEQPVIIVATEKIFIDEFRREHEKSRNFYKEIYKDEFNKEIEDKLKLKEKVLDSLIEERILLIDAKNRGITVSEAELQDTIRNTPVFMKEGIFNRDLYLRTLELNHLTIEFYEEMKRKELTLMKMREFITKDINDLETKHRAIREYIEKFKQGLDIKINYNLLSSL